jgi:hypothetical protein
MPGPAWTMILLFVLPCLAEMTGMYYHIQPLVEMGYHGLSLSLSLFSYSELKCS